MEHFKRVVLQVFLLSAVLCLAYSQTCPAKKQSNVKFTINSRRNQTGHWVAQVRVVRKAEDESDSRPWTAEVEQTVTNCNGQDSVELDIALTSPPPRAGPGYELYSGVGYYKLHTEFKTWADAEKICEQEGAHLAIINSKEEEAVLRSIWGPYAEQKNIDWASIGFHDLYMEGQYLTVFDEPLESTGYVNWCPGQPDNYRGNDTHPGEDCGSIYRTACINDHTCDSKVAFICEQELW